MSELVFEGDFRIQSIQTFFPGNRAVVQLEVWGWEPVIQNEAGDINDFFGKRVRLTLETIEEDKDV